MNSGMWTRTIYEKVKAETGSSQECQKQLIKSSIGILFFGLLQQLLSHSPDLIFLLHSFFLESSNMTRTCVSKLILRQQYCIKEFYKLNNADITQGRK